MSTFAARQAAPIPSEQDRFARVAATSRPDAPLPSTPALSSASTASYETRGAAPTPTYDERASRLADAGAAHVTAKDPYARPSLDDLDAIGLAAGLAAGLTYRELAERKLATWRNSFHRGRYGNRLLVCLTAIALLWLTSLALVRAIVNAAIEGPPIDTVISMGQASLANTQYIKASYEVCANRLVNECNDTLNAAMQAQIDKMSLAQATNRAVIDFDYDLRGNCSNEVMWIVDALVRMQSAPYLVQDPKTTFFTSYTFTDPRCGLVDQLLQGNAGGLQALGASDRYQGDATAQIQMSNAAIVARQAYDAQYAANKSVQLAFIANTTLPALLQDPAALYANLNRSRDQYMACISLTGVYNGQTCPSTPAVLQRAQQMRSDALSRYANAQAQVQAWNASAQATIAQVNAFYVSIANNAGLKALIDAVLILQGLSLAALGYLPGLDVSGQIDAMAAMALADVNQMMNDYIAQQQAYAQQLLSSQTALAKQRALLLAEQAGLPVNFTAHVGPFVPPHVNTSQNLAAWSNSSTGFLGSMGASLTNQTAAVNDNAQFVAAQVNQTSPQNYSSALLANTQARLFDFYVYPGFSILDFKNTWNYLINTAVAFDFAFRVLRSLMLFRKYWRIGAITTPPADVRVDHMQNYGLYASQQNTAQKIAAILAHPATQCMVLSIIFSLIASSFYALYFPVYNQYVRGCVEQASFDSGPGTMLSNNVFNISLNYAASQGDKTTSVAVDRINVRRDVQCKALITSSQQQQLSDQNEWDFVHRKQVDLQYQSSSLYDCINMPLADVANMAFGNPTACFQGSGGNCTHLTDVSPGSHCLQNVSALVDATFNCTDVTCSAGVRCNLTVISDSIEGSTWEASCHAEWFMHANILGSIMVILTFVLMNASRIICMRGFARLFWRQLTDGRFGYLGTSDRAGELKYPNLITLEGYSMKRAIRESLAARIRWWERRSWFIMCFGLALNLPWIGLLCMLGSTMSVRSNAAGQ